MDIDRYRETQYRLVEAITGVHRNTQIAHHKAAIRQIMVSPGEKIRRSQPIKVRGFRRGR